VGLKIGRRNKFEILGGILNICKGKGSSKTKIVYQVNLNFRNAGLYLDWLTRRGYIAKDGKLHMTTPAGLKLLESLNDITSIIKDDHDDDPDIAP
jgi:predicted transcriptional regulator